MAKSGHKSAVDAVRESAQRIERMVPLLWRKLPTAGWHALSHNSQALLSVIGKAKSQPAWKVDLVPLDLSVPQAEMRGMKVRPAGARVDSVRLSGSMSGTFDGSSDHRDPFLTMKLAFVVKGTLCDGNGCCWAFHVDRHDAPPLSLPASSDVVPHPLYHVQFGGHDLGDAGGPGLLVLDVPRIGCPPMDYAMAVDYLLSSFAPLTWRRIRQDPSYRGSMRSAYAAYWAPFFEALVHGLRKGAEPSVVQAVSRLMPLASFV